MSSEHATLGLLEGWQARCAAFYGNLAKNAAAARTAGGA
jgi:hypothetical protein